MVYSLNHFFIQFIIVILQYINIIKWELLKQSHLQRNKTNWPIY